MAEVNLEAMLLITISYQALTRAKLRNSATLLCDSTVTILFASIFIEANLNYILKTMGLTSEMEQSLGKTYPGLQDKLCWFYNKFVARNKVSEWDKKGEKERVIKKLWRRFPGYRMIYMFRNDIAHGDIDLSMVNLNRAIILRQQAKDIVDELLMIANREAKKKKYVIQRITNFSDVTALTREKQGSFLDQPNQFISLVNSSS